MLKKPREYADFGEFQLLAREGDVALPKVPREEPLRMQARAFLEGLNAPETLRSDGRFAAAVVRVAAAINDSISIGGAPVKVSPAGSDNVPRRD